MSGLAPKADISHHFRPEREKPALYRFDLVNGAAPTVAKVALPSLRTFWLAQPNEMLGAVDVTLFEFSDGKAKMARSPLQIVFGQIYIALDVTAAAAAGQAGETETVSRVHTKGSVKVQIQSTLHSITLSIWSAEESTGQGCFAG